MAKMKSRWGHWVLRSIVMFVSLEPTVSVFRLSRRRPKPSRPTASPPYRIITNMGFSHRTETAAPSASAADISDEPEALVRVAAAAGVPSGRCESVPRTSHHAGRLGLGRECWQPPEQPVRHGNKSHTTTTLPVPAAAAVPLLALDELSLAKRRAPARTAASRAGVWTLPPAGRIRRRRHGDGGN